MTDPILRVFPDPAAVAAEAARRVAELAAEYAGRNGKFTLALSGGRTPEDLYRLLAGEPFKSRIDWPAVEIYFGDERCVPPDHADSNYRMARNALLGAVPLPPQNVHRVRGEIDPQAAAAEYGRLLKERFGDDGGIDLVLLGMGDDGHTASLFPGTAALDEGKHRCVANWVPKFNAWRVTMTAPFINRAAHVMILAPGANKAARIKEVLEGPRDPARLPIQLIQPAGGTLTWMLDTGASGM